MSTLQPTLLVFTLGATAERRRHPLVRPAIANLECELRRACLDRLLAAGSAVGCSVVATSAEPIPGVERLTEQGQGDFGSRLVRAMAPIEISTDQPLVVVGTDIPDLGRRQIQAAVDSLGSGANRVVVGPSPDGGIYLLAASCRLDEVLADIPWQRPDTRSHLLEALRELDIEVVELEPLRDLDDARDLERWLATTAVASAFTSIRRRLTRLLALARRAYPIAAPAPLLPLWVQAQAGRAPPA